MNMRSSCKGVAGLVVLVAGTSVFAAADEISSRNASAVVFRPQPAELAGHSEFLRAAAGAFPSIAITGPTSEGDDDSSRAPSWNRQEFATLRPLLSSQDLLVGIRGGWARYRFFADDPSDPGLVVEAMTRISEFGAKTIYLYLSPLVGSSESSLVQVAQTPRFQNVFSQASTKQFRLLTFFAAGMYPGGLAANWIPQGTPNGTGLPLPYTGSNPSEEAALLQEEYNQVYNLAVYLRNNATLNGIAVVLKNWEGDNTPFCGGFSSSEAAAVGDASLIGVSGCNYSAASGADNTKKQALLNRAVHVAKWLRTRQDAVAAARAATPGSSVPVYHAAEVSGAEAALGVHGSFLAAGPHLQIEHLLPYIGPDMISYSSWQTIYDPSLPADAPAYTQLYSTLTSWLYGAFDFFLSQTTQKNAAVTLCQNQGVCLTSVGFGTGSLSERTADPMGLGAKRLIIAEYSVGENDDSPYPSNALESAVGRVPAILDAARCYPGTIQEPCSGGIKAAYYWTLYDNEMAWETACTDPMSGKGYQCHSGGTPLCDPNFTTSSVPGAGCFDKNLWVQFPAFTLGRFDGTGPGPGYCIYRPDGYESAPLALLQKYVLQDHPGLWMANVPGPPVNLHFSQQPFVLGLPDVNALIWELPSFDSRYVTYQINVTGPQSFSASTYHRWLTLDASMPAGVYSWQIRATAANGLLASAWISGPGFRIAGPAKFYTVTPCRVFDTRNPSGPLGGPSIAANGQRTFPIAGTCGIPSTALSVSANITGVPAAGASGAFAVFPGNGTNTGTSTLSFNAGKVRANNAMLLLATDGSGTILVVNSSSSANDVVLDVNGYFQ